MAVQAQAGDLNGVVQTKADLDDSPYSHSPEVHTAYVRWASHTPVHFCIWICHYTACRCLGCTYHKVVHRTYGHKPLVYNNMLTYSHIAPFCNQGAHHGEGSVLSGDWLSTGTVSSFRTRRWGHDLACSCIASTVEQAGETKR